MAYRVPRGSRALLVACALGMLALPLVVLFLVAVPGVGVLEALAAGAVVFVGLGVLAVRAGADTR